MALKVPGRNDCSAAAASPGRGLSPRPGRDAGANAAREGSGARPPGHRGPAELPRPWEPRSARVFGARPARSGPRPSGSCRPHRVPDSQPRESRESDAGRRPSMGPGLRGQRAAASRRHRAAQPPVTSRRGPSPFGLPTVGAHGAAAAVFAFLSWFSAGLRRPGGSWEAAASLPGCGVATIPGGSRSRRPVHQRPAVSGHRCRSASLSRFPDLCPEPVPPTGQRPPASCAPQPPGVAPLPSEPQRSQ